MLAIAVSAAVGLADRGVAVVGAVPAGLPSVELPDLRLRDVFDLLPPALGIFFVNFGSGILTARSFAGRHGQHTEANTELTAMGAASLVAGVSQGFPVGASSSRTAVNDQMVARTQVSGLVAAVVVALVLLFLTAPIEYLPTATLAAVIVTAALGLVDLDAWRGLARINRMEVGIAAVAMIGVSTVGVLRALLIAIALSLVDAVRRSADPHDAVLGYVERLDRYAGVRLHPSAQTAPGVLVYRLDDRLFFANANYVKGRIREAIAGARTPIRWLVFDAEALNHVDATGVRVLTELIEALREESITFVFARLHSQMKQELEEAGVLDLVGEDHDYPTVHAAVAAAPSNEERQPALLIWRPSTGSGQRPSTGSGQRPSTGSGLTYHTPEANVAHAGIDHLRPARGGSVTHAIAVRAEIGTALDHFPRHPELGLPPVIAVINAASPRIARDATGLVYLSRVTVDVPVGGPVPDVPGHVVQAVPVWWKTPDRGGRAVTSVGSPWEVPVPEVGKPAIDRFRLVAPCEDHLRQPAACRRFPFGFGRQAAAGPVRVRFGIFVSNMDHRVIFASAEGRPRAFGIEPASAQSPGPPQIDMTDIHRPRGTREHHRSGLQVLFRRTGKVGRIKWPLRERDIARGIDELRMAVCRTCSGRSAA